MRSIYRIYISRVKRISRVEDTLTKRSNTMKIELCCGSLGDAITAYKNGADRVELCSCIYFGGLTPSPNALTILKEKTGIETAVMIRPREGGFCYDETEFELMLHDGDEMIKRGADALVFGFLTHDGYIDEDKTARFMAMINGRCQSVFHKAFDVCKDDLIEGAQKLHRLGVSRILTAGKKKTAIDGAENLKKLIDLHTIGILPAGSVRAHNLQELYEKTGTDWAHTSAFEPCFDNSSDHDSILFTPTKPAQQGEYPKANGEIVKGIVDIARKI